jgi:hypothetical protein
LVLSNSLVELDRAHLVHQVASLADAEVRAALQY